MRQKTAVDWDIEKPTVVFATGHLIAHGAPVRIINHQELGEFGEFENKGFAVQVKYPRNPWTNIFVGGRAKLRKYLEANPDIHVIFHQG